MYPSLTTNIARMHMENSLMDLWFAPVILLKVVKMHVQEMMEVHLCVMVDCRELLVGALIVQHQVIHICMSEFVNMSTGLKRLSDGTNSIKLLLNSVCTHLTSKKNRDLIFSLSGWFSVITTVVSWTCRQSSWLSQNLTSSKSQLKISPQDFNWPWWWLRW